MEPTTGKAKYYTLMEALKEQILSGTIKPGQKLPSENELTKEYALSRHTVRKALALLENEGYITAQHGKGTFCSERVIQRHNSKNIAVVTTYLSDYIFPRLIQGMDRVLSENGYSIILKNTCNSRSKEEKVLKELLDKPIDGLIIEPSKSQILCRHINLYEMLDKYQIPYVFIQGCYPQMADKPCILMDDCKGGYLLTRHLLETGRRNIIGIFKADDSQGAQRHKGYQIVQQDFAEEVQEGRGRGRPEAQQHLQTAVDQTGEQAPLDAVAEGHQHKGQHAEQGDAAAVGHGEDADVGQHRANGDHQGAFDQNAGLGISFRHFGFAPQYK